MSLRAGSVLFWSAAALVSVSIGSAAGPVVWRIAGEDGAMLPPAAAASGTAAPDRIDLSPILAFAPFGRAVTAAPVAAVTGETSLGLTLLGVTIASTDSGSRAMIAASGAPAESFGIGSEVAPGVTLVRVAGDHVVLQVQDRLETLSFESGTDAAAPRRAGTGPDLMNLIPAPAAAASATGSDEPDAVIARYRAQIQMNAQGVLDTLGLVPTDAGYLIADSAAPGVRQAGFRPGDLVTTVNGRRVGDVNSDRSYFDDIAASGRARVEVMRDGQTIVMSFPLR